MFKTLQIAKCARFTWPLFLVFQAKAGPIVSGGGAAAAHQSRTRNQAISSNGMGFVINADGFVRCGARESDERAEGDGCVVAKRCRGFMCERKWEKLSWDQYLALWKPGARRIAIQPVHWGRPSVLIYYREAR